MINMTEFMDTVIGAKINVRENDKTDEVTYTVDSIEESEEIDCTFDIVTEEGNKFNVPSLEIIDNIFKGTPYITVGLSIVKA